MRRSHLEERGARHSPRLLRLSFGYVLSQEVKGAKNHGSLALMRSVKLSSKGNEGKNLSSRKKRNLEVF